MRVDEAARAQVQEILNHGSQIQAVGFDLGGLRLDIDNAHATAQGPGQVNSGDAGRGLDHVQLGLRRKVKVDGGDIGIARQLLQHFAGERGCDDWSQLVGARPGVERAHAFDDRCHERFQRGGARLGHFGIERVDRFWRKRFTVGFRAIPASLGRIAHPDRDGDRLVAALVDALGKCAIEGTEPTDALLSLIPRQGPRIRGTQLLIDRDGVEQSLVIADLERLNRQIQIRVVRGAHRRHAQRFGTHPELLADRGECHEGSLGIRRRVAGGQRR